MIHFFNDSESLQAFVAENNTFERHGDMLFGSLEFIDSRDLHVVFEKRIDYERWDAAGRPVQLTLF